MLHTDMVWKSNCIMRLLNDKSQNKNSYCIFCYFFFHLKFFINYNIKDIVTCTKVLLNYPCTFL